MRWEVSGAPLKISWGKRRQATKAMGQSRNTGLKASRNYRLRIRCFFEIIFCYAIRRWNGTLPIIHDNESLPTQSIP